MVLDLPSGVLCSVAFLVLDLLASVLGRLPSAWYALLGYCWMSLLVVLTGPRVLHDGTRGPDVECWPHSGRERLY